QNDSARHYERSRSKAISASGRGHGRAAGGPADRVGTGLSVAAGPPPCCRWRRRRGREPLPALLAKGGGGGCGHPCLLCNSPGGATNTGTEAAVRSPADGYTLLLSALSNAVNATLYDNLNFNFIRDMVPVAGIIRVSNVMYAHPSVPATTLPEFIAYAKANPGKINMASAGNGSSSHMAGELFKLLAGVDLVHVPY